MPLLSKLLRRYTGKRLCENVNRTGFDRHCLLLYVTEPFQSETLNINHQNQWQARELARIVGEFGYNVDVVRYSDNGVKLTKSYDLVIDLHPGLNDCYRGHVTSGCRRIAYITGSNPAVANRAEQGRLADLYERRGVHLKPRRQAKPFAREEMEAFDALFFIGNEYNLQSYAEFRLPQVFFIRNTGVCHFADLAAGDRSATDFLFLASGGQVHKGLDLLLEVFGRHRGLNLHVCSSFQAERDFCRAFRQELFRSANIHPAGFVATDGPRFREICSRCSFVVLPSCAEANAGSVLTAMACGLIPIVSRECGFSTDEVHYLDDCSIATIASTLESFSQQSPQWLANESRRAVQVVAERYSMANYTESVRAALHGVLT